MLKSFEGSIANVWYMATKNLEVKHTIIYPIWKNGYTVTNICEFIGSKDLVMAYWRISSIPHSTRSRFLRAWDGHNIFTYIAHRITSSQKINVLFWKTSLRKLYSINNVHSFNYIVLLRIEWNYALMLNPILVEIFFIFIRAHYLPLIVRREPICDYVSYPIPTWKSLKVLKSFDLLFNKYTQHIPV